VKLVVLALKLAITGLLVWLLMTHVDLAPIGDFLKSPDALGAIAICVAMFLGQAVLAALRLRWIMRLMGADLPMGLSYSTWMVSLLVSQTMLTFIAGDAARIWRFTQAGYSKQLTGGAIFLERALGCAVLMVLTLVSMPFLLDRDPSLAVRTGLYTIGGLCAAGVIGFVLSGFFHRVMVHIAPRFDESRIGSVVVDVLSAARYLRQSWSVSAGVIGLTVIMHVCNAVTFYILGTAAHAGLDVTAAVIVAMPVMLIALFPIALAGWGVRESAAAVAFGLYDVAPQTAVTISVAFGVALVIASLPGALFLWKDKAQVQAALEPKTP
jgi:uncharacterized membrane protein YbhN (UPF0104 family)